jgi:hypothetical protein
MNSAAIGVRGFWCEAQRVHEKRLWASLPSSLRITCIASVRLYELSDGHKSCRALGSPSGEARQQHSHNPGNEYSVKSASAAD